MRITFTLLLALACTADKTASNEPSPDASTSPDALAPPDAPTPPVGRKLVLLFGQSNAGSKGLVSELTGSDVALATPEPDVPFTGVVGNVGTTTTEVTYPLGPLAPQTDYKGVAGTFGMELSMGHALEAAQPGQWAIAKYSLGSTSLYANWQPGGAWPTPVDDLFAQCLAFTQHALADTHATSGAFVWIQGEEDAAGATVVSAAAEQYGMRLAEFIAAERYMLPASESVPWFVGQLNIHYPGVGDADVRAGENGNASASVTVVDQDAYPLQSDDTHYTTAGVVALGQVYAQAILAAVPLR